MIRAVIIGGSGYTGGELLRLLIPHPEVELVQVTSRQHLGEYIYQVHPNLRKQSTLKFTDPDTLESTLQSAGSQTIDVLFLALPHGQAQKQIDRWAALSSHIIDLSADFRLRDPQVYKHWYGEDHLAPQWLDKFVYGSPELHREQIRQAKYVSGVGCNATATILALLPAINQGLLDTSRPIIAEIKVGSSEGGTEVNPGSHHPERSGVIRTYAAYGHRHTAEVIQELGLSDVSLTMTSVDLVRGALATAHAYVKEGVTTKELWQAYRVMTTDHPFLRIVKERRGIYRVPEPKILAGSNYADLGFDLDPDTGHLIAMCGIDNLVKGAAGSAIQSMNLMFGFEETQGLAFSGLHPI